MSTTTVAPAESSSNVFNVSSDELSHFAKTGEMPAAEPAPAPEPPKETSEPPEPKAGKVETASESETDEENDGDAGQEPAKQISNRDRKIARLTAQREYQRARADQVARELEQLRTAATKGAEPKATPRDETGAPVAPKEPSLNEFDSLQAFEEAERKYKEELSKHNEALIEWKLEQRERKARSEQAMKTLAERVQAFSDKTPDFEEVADSVNLDASPALKHALFEIPEAPELIYHYGKHPEALAALSAMQPASQMIEIGRQLERMKAPAASPEKQKAKPLTSAPAPVEPVGATVKTAEPSEITPDGFLNPDWEEKHLAKLAKRRR